MSNWAVAGGAGCWHGLMFFLLGLVLVYIIDFQVFLSFLLCFFRLVCICKITTGVCGNVAEEKNYFS